MKKSFYLGFLLLIGCISCAQKNTNSLQSELNHVQVEQAPYHQIPEYPESYSANNVVARMIDGLGYRYHWATKDLRKEDLDYRSSEDARPAIETLHHIYGLVEVINNAVKGKPSLRPLPENNWSFEEMRLATLNLLQEASELLKANPTNNFEEMKVIFKRGARESSFEFWHNLNGPLSDALWHTGQIVMLRRASGNPLPPGVNVFMGKTRAE